jgi:hypothetical protein
MTRKQQIALTITLQLIMNPSVQRKIEELIRPKNTIIGFAPSQSVMSARQRRIRLAIANAIQDFRQ